MKHKHYEMIVAKAANMDLVLFFRHGNGGLWFEDKEEHNTICFDNEGSNYFLCLPQHKEACLHWLNGGVVQYEHVVKNLGIYTLMIEYRGFKWSLDMLFMDEEFTSRIKPKKEKRWIGVRKSDITVESVTYKSLADAQDDCPEDYWTHHEIEVEV